jgi:rubredoxin
MADKEKETEEKPVKKSEVLYSEDVAEIVDIYAQLDEMLMKGKFKNPPTADDVEGLAATIFIQRKKGGQFTPEKPLPSESIPAGKKKDTRDCPQCGAVLLPKKSKAGKQYFACDVCKGFANNDGSFTPFRQQ